MVADVDGLEGVDEGSDLHEMTRLPAQGVAGKGGRKSRKAGKVCSQQALRDLQDLREFLKIVKPDWSIIPGQHGHSNVERVLQKLQEIGVRSIEELMCRVEDNTINENLFHAKKAIFSQSTLNSFRNKKRFLMVMDQLKERHYRQVGIFAPVPQLLAKTNRAAVLRKRLQGDGAAKDRAGDGAAKDRAKARHRAEQSVPLAWDGPEERADASSSADDGEAKESPLKGRQLRPPPLRRKVPSSLSLLSQETRERSPRIGFGAEVEATDGWLPPSSTAVAHDANGVMLRPSLRFVTTAGAGSRPRSQQLRSGHGERPWRSLSQGMARPRSAPGVESQAKEEGEPGCASFAHSLTAPASFPSASRSCGALLRPDRRGSQPMRSQPLPGVASEAMADEDLGLLEAHAARMHSAAQEMQRERRHPRWSALQRTTLLAQGEAVLREHQALEDQDNMMKAMRREGDNSATRRSITENIKQRLLEEAKRESKNPSYIERNMTCTNIKDQLSYLQHARQELSTIKAQAKSVVEPDCPDIPHGLSVFKARYSTAAADAVQADVSRALLPQSRSQSKN